MSDSDPEPWQVFALKYAERSDAMKREHFIFTDAHDGPMPMDYYIWALRNEAGRIIVVDMGFDEAEGKKRKRNVLRTPSEALASIGIDAAEVEELVVSHMHYDHCGNSEQFPDLHRVLKSSSPLQSNSTIDYGVLEAPYYLTLQTDH